MDMHEHKNVNSYNTLIIMAALSFLSMYALMYAMVDRFANVIPNINQFYMAGLMTMPMIIFEVVLMRSMYMNKKLNTMIFAIGAVALVAFFLFIRQQSFVSDRQFLKSMIPHHASAILMCENADLQDLEIRELCASIVSSQQQEIDWMKAKLEEFEK